MLAPSSSGLILFSPRSASSSVPLLHSRDLSFLVPAFSFCASLLLQPLLPTTESVTSQASAKHFAPQVRKKQRKPFSTDLVSPRRFGDASLFSDSNNTCCHLRSVGFVQLPVRNTSCSAPPPTPVLRTPSSVIARHFVPFNLSRAFVSNLFLVHASAEGIALFFSLTPLPFRQPL